ncbi:MAG: tyrosine--tRNA ligase [Planctomycetaceae bacterium]|nr:tyrosine--tRNA ligase [Planctomycetaceae bacterium]MBT6487007.1 tyrosine--tRNA ligase [Planctomycetaceae bacterium]MBT6494240.1 tyrosine--tRNA ligase [Planctomycetaceae bacterium]
MQFPPVEEQLAIIRRGVEKIVPEEQLAKKLQHSRDTGTPLRVKYGIDPTGIDVHLGHTVPLRKMRQFQQLGHQTVIIIGNYTALVGDPSGRDETRARLTAEQVEANAVDYLNQVGKVLDLSQAEVIRNGEWFSKMAFAEILELCGRVTVAQLLTREDFAKRYKAEQPIYLHECLYPVMQAWDSVEIRSDIELGGTEQLYSFMLARDLQRQQKLPEQIGIMSPILVGLDGKKRMGKSLGNYIGISESPYEMMKKFMQLPDDCMRMYYELLTDVDIDEVNTLLAGHPKEAKVTLAKSIIGEYHDETSAEEAAARWQREIGGKEMQSDISEGFLNEDLLDENGCMQAALLLKELDLVPSTSEAMRRIKGNAAFVIIGDEKTRINDRSELIRVVEGMIVRAGKKDLKRVKFMD